MIETLQEMYKNLKINSLFFHGDTEKVIEYLIKSLDINSIFVNQDYTLFKKEIIRFHLYAKSTKLN